jgi:hypothetical protein
MNQYLVDFEEAVAEAAEKCRKDIGDMKMVLGIREGSRGSKGRASMARDRAANDGNRQPDTDYPRLR